MAQWTHSYWFARDFDGCKSKQLHASIVTFVYRNVYRDGKRGRSFFFGTRFLKYASVSIVSPTTWLPGSCAMERAKGYMRRLSGWTGCVRVTCFYPDILTGLGARSICFLLSCFFPVSSFSSLFPSILRPRPFLFFSCSFFFFKDVVGSNFRRCYLFGEISSSRCRVNLSGENNEPRWEIWRDLTI